MVLPHQEIELRDTARAWQDTLILHLHLNGIMAGYLRGKQAGIQNDLSASIRPELFTPDYQARYGINSQIRYGRAASLPRHGPQPAKRAC